MNKAAILVLSIVGLVVLGYSGADIVAAVRTGQISDAARQIQNIALGALIAFIAQTGRGNPPPADQTGPNDPKG